MNRVKEILRLCELRAGLVNVVGDRMMMRGWQGEKVLDDII